MEVIR